MGASRPSGASGGQASVELVAIIPALLACALIAAQLAAAGWAAWSAATAARSGARAALVGADAEVVARRALPGRLRDGARVREEDGVRVRVRVPSLMPGLRLPFVGATADLDVGG